MKIIWKLCFLIPLLVGCSYHKVSSDTPTPSERYCSDLKHNITFNSISSHPMGRASATQKAQMMHAYNKNNCSRFEDRL